MPEFDRAAVATGPGQFAVVPIDIPPPADDEVVVRIEACGVCHSDLHVLETGWAHRFPVVLGHEAAGVVEEVGGAVEPLRAGDRVILGWRSPCGRCRACRRGEPRRCRRPATAESRPALSDGRELSLMLGLGTLATRAIVHQSAAVAYPDALSPAEACLIGCCVATGIGSVLETARLRPGSRVAVIGCGAVGLSVVQGARLARAKEIYAIDLDEGRAAAAGRFGATATGWEEGLDAVFDVVGAPETFAAGIAALGSGGSYVLIGLPRPDTTAAVELAAFFDRRLTLLVSHGGDHLPEEDFPRLAAMALSGEVDLAGLVTKEVALDDLDAALAEMRAGRTVRSVVTKF